MTREDKGNCIMIAEFMGAKIIERENRIVCDFPKKSGLDWWLDYDTKWDWLMPVLQKIQQEGCIVGFSLTTFGNGVSISPINEDIYFNYCCDNLIEAAYKSVVDYIEFYNLNKKKNKKK